MTTIYLVRHAESIADRDKPEPEWELSEVGRAQAESLVGLLKELSITRVYSSPYTRTLDTVRPFCEATGLDVETVPDLRECERSVFFEGFEEFQNAMRLFWGDLEHSNHGEAGRTCQSRIKRAIKESVASSGENETLLFSSHGLALSLFLSTLDPAVGYDFWHAMKNPDLFKIRVENEGLIWDYNFEFEL
jgi:2,3-bisphosphoglycerate-dependent phosphoglycerate mutase